ncbi:LPO_1073/Vpar_1526 family protein [Streptomyces sp. NPDC091412]|uniref:LPO_1073/Vpar_1526 family protein n=1 Tax=Streptomyces sp. NPDC091412 TaxID=3366002 RepID=UPI00381BC56F
MIWRQKQRSGDGSTNIQAHVVQYGVSYDDAKAIAMDVFKENFSKLSQGAHRVAIERADEFTMNYLSELHDRQPQAIGNIEDPGVQSDILEAQAGFAKSGDQDLGEVLVDVLVDRTARTDRTTATLALSAAITTAQKLTSSHFAALSALFVFKQLKLFGMIHHEQLYLMITQLLGSAKDAMMRLSDSDIQYLAALGCLTISIGAAPIHQGLQQAYPGLFSDGFDISSAPATLSGAPEDGPESVVRKLKDTPAVAASPRDPTKFQVAAADNESLHKILEANGLLEYETVLRQTLTARPLHGDAIVAEMREHNPALGEIADAYDAASLPNCTNTAIGTAIAHANLRKATGGAFVSPLDIWIS